MTPSVHLASVWYAKELTPSPVAWFACKFNTWKPFNTLRARQNGRLFAGDIFKCIFLNENIRISNNISLKFVPMDLSNNIPALVFIMAWRRPGDKPLSEPMMVRSLTHICVSRPQWINKRGWKSRISFRTRINNYIRRNYEMPRRIHAYVQRWMYVLVEKSRCTPSARNSLFIP